MQKKYGHLGQIVSSFYVGRCRPKLLHTESPFKNILVLPVCKCKTIIQPCQISCNQFNHLRTHFLRKEEKDEVTLHHRHSRFTSKSNEWEQPAEL